MNAPDWLVLSRALAVAIPLTFIAGAAFVPRIGALRCAIVTTSIALVSALCTSVAAALAPAAGPDGLPVRVDVVTCAMLLLVCVLGLIIVRFSRTYLDGDPGQQRYTRSLLATLAAVGALVIANDLILIAAAWTGTSLALHQLLVFYPDRPGALVAAHKKFLVSRLGDACLWIAIALVRFAVGSTNLDVIARWAHGQSTLPVSVQLAALSFVIAASLKSAQLPFHGWLTQVMEAPTPVSALLHAGVVNIGGFLMIRLAELMARAPVAQLALLVIGLSTTVIAALVMRTCASVKVALAWSTCAQMGFMLVECALGAWHLALLHLVAHSLYKAHAFLSAGGAVDTLRIDALSPKKTPASLARRALAAVALGSLALAPLAIGSSFAADAFVLAFVAALSLVSMIAAGARDGARPLASVALRGAGVALLYFGLHAGAARLSPVPATGSAAGWAIVAIGFVALFTVQSILEARPRGRLATWLHPWLAAGLHLDERFTRLTFRIWPPRLPLRAGRGHLVVAESLEV